MLVFVTLWALLALTNGNTVHNEDWDYWSKTEIETETETSKYYAKPEVTATQQPWVNAYMDVDLAVLLDLAAGLDKLVTPAWMELVTSGYSYSAFGYSDGNESWASSLTSTSSSYPTSSSSTAVDLMWEETELSSEVTNVFDSQPERFYDHELTVTVSYAISDVTTDLSTSSVEPKGSDKGGSTSSSVDDYWPISDKDETSKYRIELSLPSTEENDHVNYTTISDIRPQKSEKLINRWRSLLNPDFLQILVLTAVVMGKCFNPILACRWCLLTSLVARRTEWGACSPEQCCEGLNLDLMSNPKIAGSVVLLVMGLYVVYRCGPRRVQTWRQPRLQAPLAPIIRPNRPLKEKTVATQVSPAVYLCATEFGSWLTMLL